MQKGVSESAVCPLVELVETWQLIGGLQVTEAPILSGGIGVRYSSKYGHPQARDQVPVPGGVVGYRRWPKGLRIRPSGNLSACEVSEESGKLPAKNFEFEEELLFHPFRVSFIRLTQPQQLATTGCVAKYRIPRTRP